MKTGDQLNTTESDIVMNTLYVRYMISLRCKKIVNDELDKLKISHSVLDYGAIEFYEDVSAKKLNTLKSNLKKFGLLLMSQTQSKLIDRIIDTIIEVIHCFDELPKLKYSEVIAKNLEEANESVLKIFSEVVGMSVVQFIVIQKVERIKELLLYETMTLSEISNKLNYKNEQQLIAQFKKCTGLTPAHYLDFRNERIKISSKVIKNPTDKNKSAKKLRDQVSSRNN
jgi:AraC-like DNA-binding protein